MLIKFEIEPDLGNWTNTPRPYTQEGQKTLKQGKAALLTFTNITK